MAVGVSTHCMKSVRIWSFCGPHFPSSDCILRDTKYLSVFRGKCGQEKLQIRAIFTQHISPIYSIMPVNCFKLLICIQLMSDRNHLSQQNIFSEHRHSLLDVLSAFCIIAPILITLYNNSNNNNNNNIQ